MNKFDKVYNTIKENTQTRFKKAMYGVLPGVKSFVIITPENPMGNKLSKQENMKKIESFKEYLKDGRYRYIRVNGKYKDIEKPFVIFNISTSDAKDISQDLDQESFIYAYNKDKKQEKNNVMFEYWEKEGNKPYKKQDEIDYFVFKNDAKKFYTRLKSWKFNIPFPIFNEEILNYNVYGIDLNEEVVNSINEINDRILCDDKTLKYQWQLRGKINACINRNI